LRVYVSGGGCAGLSYGMGFEEKADEDDRVIEKDGVKVLLDSYSERYLKTLVFSIFWRVFATCR
jgi:iron-sulfur cluster assembly protein